MNNYRRLLSAGLLLLGCAFTAGCGKDPADHVDPEVFAAAAAELDAALPAFLNDGSLLPVSELGSGLKWSVKKGNAYIKDGRIMKKRAAEEYEPVTLAVRADGNDEYVFENLVLLDEYAGHIISYFSEVTENPETMKLAYTLNGVEWFSLNNDLPVLRAAQGTQRLRDPSILRKKDGTFCVLATQGYDNDSIYVYDSGSLTAFGNERLVKVNQAPLSEKQAWAPEGFYDRLLDKYVIYWSSVEDGGMYYNLSDDLVEVSAPEPLLDAGFPVIDGTIVRQEDGWAIILKDEREPMEDYSQLFVGYAKDTWKDFGDFTDPISGHQMEGPMAMRDMENEGWYIFCDNYTNYRFVSLYSEDLFSRYFAEVPEEYLTIPLDCPAHSYAIPVTRRELDKVIAAYGQ